MRHVWLLILLLSSTARADDDEPTGTCSCELPGPPKVLTLRGTVYLKSSGTAGAGTTVTIAPHGSTSDKVVTAITDELGQWSVEITPGNYDITLYYLDATVEQAKNRLILDDVALDPIVLDDTRGGTSCWGFGHWPSAEQGSLPRFGGEISRQRLVPSRDRTHRAWIAPIAFADPARSVTTIEGGRRFTGAPGVPLAFIEDVTTYTLDTPIEHAQGGGGATAIALRAGHNQRSGDARLILGLDDGAGASAAAETLVAGPLAKDRAWVAAGLVARRQGSQLTNDGMLRLDVRGGDSHEVMLAGLAHAAGEERAGFTNARWKAKLFDYKLELGALATTELLDKPSPIAPRQLETPLAPIDRLDRAGGIGFMKLLFRARGTHQLHASAGAGIGERDGIRHTDESYAIGDDWWIAPSIAITAGVRVERRGFGGDHTQVVAPRAQLAYDPTREGRSEIYVAYQRVPLVDDGMPGDWRSAELTSVDELSTGVAYMRSTGNTMIGIAARAREERWGGEAWLRRDTRRSVIHVQASSLDRVATLLAQRKLRDRGTHKITAGVAARVGEDRSEGGLALGWRRSPRNDDELKTELSIESYAGTDGPGGRMLLGILW